VHRILKTQIPMTWAILIILAILIGLWGWYSARLVLELERFPNQVIPRAFGVQYEDVSFAAADGIPLSGWFLPAASGSDACVIICHGYGANKGDVLMHTVFLNKKNGYNLFYFDFRNHGDSGGTFTSLGAYEARDLDAAIDYLKKEKPAQSRRLGIYGLSMGAAVALSVTARRPELEAIVAESAFSSYNGVVIRFARLFYHIPRYPLLPITSLFVRWRLGLNPELSSPILHIDKISPRPLFLIQGGQDVRMPTEEGEKLFARAKEPKTLWTVPGADHGEPAEVAGQEYEDKLSQFFAGAFQGKKK
jgi:uncharacterized protein